MEKKMIMKKITGAFSLIVLLLFSCNRSNDRIFGTYFENGTMRIDYFHTGNADSETVSLDSVYAYSKWAGNRITLIDSLNYGAYFYNVFDAASGVLIYSKGFDSYFKEYQTTDKAIEGGLKKFHESAVIPMPKTNIIFTLLKRNKTGTFDEIFKAEIDPSQAREKKPDKDVKIYTSLESGDINQKVDIAVIGEGYTAGEEQKFNDDLERFTGIFFSREPFKSNKDYFNFRGVLKYSAESGVDEPDAGIDRSTAVNASFNSLGSERYLLTEDNKSLRDIAGNVPYDALYIMVNSSRYGGGGIYNFYSVFTTNNVNSDYVMVHEFGHSFFGLADEYYTSSTSYNDFYPKGVEPVEPNITALADPENIKWKDLLTPGISIPTPWDKAVYDSLDIQWQIRRAAMNEHISMLKKNKASAEEIGKANDEYDRESLKQDSLMTALLNGSKYAGTVGAFEGAGYQSTGLYRPSLNCIMFTRVDYFCPVCLAAMMEVIKKYTR
jgi:hypothetical protein